MPAAGGTNLGLLECPIIGSGSLSYQLVNVSIGWLDPSRNFRVTLWAKNLFGKEYFTQLTEQSGLGDAAVSAVPRTYGIRFGITL